METVIKAIPIVLCALVVINALIGFSGGLRKSIFVIIANAVAIVLTVILTPKLISIFGNKLLAAFFKNLGPELSNHDSFKNLVQIFALSMVSVIVFALFYILLYILSRVIFSAISGKKQKPKFLGRILSMVVSAANCVVFLGVIILPIHTLACNICEDAVIVLDTKTSNKAATDLINDLNELVNGFVPGEDVQKMADSRMLPGKLLYDMLTPIKVGERKSKLHTETLELANICSEILAKMPDSGDSELTLNKETINAVKDIKAICFKSDLLKDIFVETVNDACQAWSEGKTYLEIEDPAKGTDYEAAVRNMYPKLAKADADQIDSMLDAILRLLDVASSANLFAEGKMPETPSGMLEAINNKETMSAIFDSINEDTAPIITELLSAALGTDTTVKTNEDNSGSKSGDDKTSTQKTTESSAVEKMVPALVNAIANVPAEEKEAEVEATMEGLEIVGGFMDCESEAEKAAFITENIDRIMEVTTSSKVMAETVANMAENGDIDVDLNPIDQLLVQAALDSYISTVDPDDRERVTDILNIYADVLGIPGIK